MTKLFHYLLLLLFSQICVADTVTMAFGERIPPFCFPETNSGIELEVIGEALAYRGHTLAPKYYPFARIPVVFKQQKVDAAMTDLGENMEAAGAFYGDPAVLYYNAFITLKRNNISIEKPDDLKDLSVISFQGASKRFPLWLDSIKESGRYIEKNDQKTQVLMLKNNRADVVLSDIYIYKYFEIQAYKALGKKAALTDEHHVIETNPMDYRPVFRSEKIRDDFNAGLKYMKDNGRIREIYNKYISE